MLALALGGRTVAEWQRAMTPGEFEAWAAYYKLWPFDDLHRHHRPAALVAGSMAGKVGDHLSWLQPAGGFAGAGTGGDGVPLDDDDAESAAGDGDEAGGLEAAAAWGGATGGVAHDGVAAGGDAAADGRTAGVMAGTAGAAAAARGAPGTPASPQPPAPRRTAADIATLRAFGLWKNGKVVKR